MTTKRGAWQELAGWGRYARARVRVVQPLQSADIVPDEPQIARGRGRSYGSAALLTNGLVIDTIKLNDIAAFSSQTGLLRAEAGLTLDAILREYVPQGWFPSVTPGTKYVSLGGCIAADVHGKNHHHTGSFSAYLEEIELITANGATLNCTPQCNAAAFWATVGGMGLTGVISQAAWRLRPIETAYLTVQEHRAHDLDDAFALLTERQWDDEYSVLWLDCVARGRKLGRGILLNGHHTRLNDLPSRYRAAPLMPHRAPLLRVPCDAPHWLLNYPLLKIFNASYYAWHSRRREPFVTHYDSYFYPLDAIAAWNRLYGRRGFVQYQCVLPPTTAHTGCQEILEELARCMQYSFLAVLKRLGAESQGLLSFPCEGYTLALDVPVHDATALWTALARLDEIVLRHGGRVYMAKDARLNAATFRAMYPRLSEWQRHKATLDPHCVFRSDLAEALGLNF